MSRKRREPDAKTLIRFIAEHESLALTVEEFPELTEDRLRLVLREFAEMAELPRRPVPVVSKATEQPAEESVTSTKPIPKTGLKRAVIHTDGACRGNPGPSGAGWVISTPEGEMVQRGGAFLGRKTNNEAEYEALLYALSAARKIGVEEVMLFADSELMIKQLNGEYQVKNERIAVLHAKARDLARGFRKFVAKHVRREQNSEADAAANEAIDNADRASSNY